MNNNKTGATDVHTEFRDRIVEIARRPIGDVRPNPRNPRKHGAGQRSRLSAVLDAFGKVGVLLSFIDDDGVETLFDGHARQGIDPAEVWHVARTDLTRREVDELVIMYDPLAAEAETDTAILSALVADYDRADPVLAEMVAGLAADAGIAFAGEPEADAEPQHDRAEELRAAWGVETGQLWRLPSRTPGQEHRLICGDCTDAAVVGRLPPPFDMMFTDPPYGVGYTGGHFHSGDVNIKRERDKLAGDLDDVYARFLPVVMPLVDGPCYVWFADRGGKPVFDAITAAGGQIHAMLIWHKTNATYAAMNAQYKQRHEPCMYFKRNGATLRWNGPTDERTVWEIPRDPVNDLHPTQKPVALAQRAIGNHSVATVADFFGGSGSTIIAAENLARQCRAVEISPAYVAVALQRYRDAFGIEPELIA